MVGAWDTERKRGLENIIITGGGSTK